jgi:hypothetical protein
MIAWGAILSSEQVVQLVNFIEGLPIDEARPDSQEADEEDEEPSSSEEETPSDEPEEEVDIEEEPELISFGAIIAPLLESRCVDCHGTDGGWDASSYELFMNSGDHAPVVIPGDPDGSLLAQKLLGTHSEGDSMPPPPLRLLNDALIQLFLDWIAAGAPE